MTLVVVTVDMEVPNVNILPVVRFPKTIHQFAVLMEVASVQINVPATLIMLDPFVNIPLVMGYCLMIPECVQDKDLALPMIIAVALQVPMELSANILRALVICPVIQMCVLPMALAPL